MFGIAIMIFLIFSSTSFSLCRQLSYDSCTGSFNFFLHFFCFFFFTLCHQRTDLFADFVFICTQGFYFLFNISVFLIQSDDFIYQSGFSDPGIYYEYSAFTTSGFSLTNLISNIFSSLFQVTILVLYYNK